MTRKEYKECLDYELYQYYRETGEKLTFLQKFRIKYMQPNTNCIWLARKMWYLYSRGGINRFYSKLIYLRIIHKYGCVIFPTAVVGRGFHITHPVGIVLGRCTAGQNFMIYQNCTVGTRRPDEGVPNIGDNVHLCTGSVLIGDISVVSDVVIGACSLVIKSISEPGIYAGNPIVRIK